MYVICRIEPDPLPGNIQEADAAQENHIMELEVSSFHADDEEADNNSSVCEGTQDRSKLEALTENFL